MSRGACQARHRGTNRGDGVALEDADALFGLGEESLHPLLVGDQLLVGHCNPTGKIQEIFSLENDTI